jgi:putative ABC transport system permease protein
MWVVVRLLLAAVRARGWVSLATFGVAVLAAVAAASGPLWIRAAEESLVRDALVAAPPARTQFAAQGAVTQEAEPDDVLGSVEAAMRAPSLDRWFGPPDLSAWLPNVTLRRGGRDFALARIGWFERACTTVVVVEGRCPAALGETLLGDDAKALGARVGDALELGRIDLPPGTTARVVGFYRPDAADSTIWAGQNVFDGAPAAAGVLDQVDTVFVARETVLSTSSVDFRAAGSRPFRPETVRLDDVPAVVGAVRRLTDPARLTIAQVTSSLPAEIRGLARERDVVRVTAAAVVLQLTLLAMVVLHLVCLAGTEAREPELAVAKLRGVRPGRALVLVLAEPALLLLAGAAAGLLAAWPLTWLLTRSTLRPDTPVAMVPGAVAAVAGVVVAGVVVAALSSRRSVLAPLAEQLRHATGARTSRRRTAVLDTALVVGAAAAVYESAQGRTDLLTLAGPGILAFAAGLLLTHLLRPGAGVVQRATRWSPRTVLYLASRQVARRPATHRLLVLAAAVVALAAFAVDCSLVAERNRAERAAVEVGAHTVLHVSGTSPGRLLDAVRAADPGGREAMAVVESRQASPSGAVLAVDTTRLSAVSPATLRHTELGAADLVRRLRPPVAAPVVVRDGVTVDLTASSVTLPLYLVAHVRLPTGGERALELGRLVDGRRRYAATDPACATGCRLAALEMDVRDPTASSVATLVVHRLADARGTAVPPSALLRWRGVPSDPALYYSLPTVTIGPAPGGVFVGVSGRGDTVSAIVPDDHPPYLQGVTGPEVSDLNAVPGKGLPAGGLDGANTLLQRVGRTVVLPRVGTEAALVDLEYADRAAGDLPSGVEYQVWLAPGAAPRITAALTAAGLRVDATETTAQRRRELDREGVAVGLRLYLVASAAGLALVLGAIVAVLLAGAARRGWEVSVLRVLGTSRRDVAAATALEHGVLLGVGAAAGVVAGVTAAWLSLPALVVATTSPGDVPVTTAPAWGALLLFVAGVAVAVAAVSAAAALATVRAARTSRLREAQP